jgi:hypothetical protein
MFARPTLIIALLCSIINEAVALATLSFLRPAIFDQNASSNHQGMIQAIKDKMHTLVLRPAFHLPSSVPPLGQPHCPPRHHHTGLCSCCPHRCTGNSQ